MTDESRAFLFNPLEILLIEAAKHLPTGQHFTLTSEASAIQFESTDVTTSQATLVMFGNMTWQHLQQLVEQVANNLLSVSVKRPSDKLSAAIEFNLSKLVAEENKKNLMAWAEQSDVELCYLESKVTLSKPGLIVMDMDSTAIQIECIDEIAKLAGVGEEVAAVTEQAMRGELDFAESLKARVATLKDAPISVIDEVANNLPLMPGLENLVQVLKQNNWKVVIASGGFTYMTEKLKQQLGLDKTVANQLGMAAGVLTGEVHGVIVDAKAKADTVESLAVEWGIPMSQTIAMGDGANDLVMMKAAELGVAFHAKPLVREQADVSVRTGGLDQLLYLL